MNSTPTNSTVAAVVVTFNRKDLLCQCLDGILAQSRPVNALYVIDNASTDGTDQLIQERYADSVKYIRMPENVGGAGGFHHGMELAYHQGFEHIWIMDDDVRPEPNCLQSLVNASLNANVVAPLHISLEGDVVDQNDVCGEARVSLAEYVSRPGRIPESVGVGHVSFEGPLIHRSVVSAAGLPRQDFFTWGEDGEYSRRILRLGLGPLHSVTAAKMVRLLPYTTSAQPAWRTYYQRRNGLFINRHYAGSLPRRLLVDLRFFLSWVRGIVRPRVLDGPANVKLVAWLDSFRDPMPTRYLPPRIKAKAETGSQQG
jgi:GT2 family glycosyltransferase